MEFSLETDIRESWFSVKNEYRGLKFCTLVHHGACFILCHYAAKLFPKSGLPDWKMANFHPNLLWREQILCNGCASRVEVLHTYSWWWLLHFISLRRPAISEIRVAILDITAILLPQRQYLPNGWTWRPGIVHIQRAEYSMSCRYGNDLFLKLGLPDRETCLPN